MLVSRIFLLFIALGLGFVGLNYLIEPNLLLSRYDLSVADADMDNMLRSAYGGIFLAAAAYILLGAIRTDRTHDAVGLVCLLMAGAALGRLVSIAALGPAHPMINALLAFEIVAVMIGGVLYFRRRPAGTV
ncbi:MAG: DUF4345 domain-containing protein [Candidatus Phaeomarinobacter sp.]|mgnify:CR=1 FL=1